MVTSATEVGNRPHGNVVTLAPPLNAAEDDLQLGLDIVERSLAGMA